MFEKNLAQLRRTDAAVSRALEAAGLEGVEIAEGPRGGRTVSCDGVLLASAYAPEREGERLAEEMDREQADLLVAIGFGLGHHIEAYQRRCACPVVIYEPSLPRLRAAFSVRSVHTLLSRKNVRFANDPETLAQLVKKFYTPGLRIQVFPHPTMLRLAANEVREAVRSVSGAKSVIDVQVCTRVKMAAPWAGITVDNAGRLLETPSFSRLFDAFRGVPAVVAAAGPSLDKQLPLLAREQGRLLVIAIGQSLRALRKAGVEPDLVHVVESLDVSRQFDDTGDLSTLNTVLLPSVHSKVFDLPVGSCFVSYPAANQIGRWIATSLGDTRWVLGGATVAQSAVQLAAAAGANPILLIGQDLAYTDGRVYAANSAYDYVGLERRGDGAYVLTGHQQKIAQLGQELRGSELPEQRKLVWVEGWDGEPVATSASYASFIDNYREIAAYLGNGGTRLVNCTEGGARTPGLEHLPFADVLGQCPREPVAAEEIIRVAHAAGSPVTPERFEAPLRKARRALDSVEKEARAGISRVQSARTALRVAKAPERQIEILRGVGRCDRRVRRGLEGVPWLDALVQPAIAQALAAFRRAQDVPPTPSEAVEESCALFEAVVEGVDQARELLDRFEARITPAVAEDEDCPLAADAWPAVTEGEDSSLADDTRPNGETP